LLTLVAGTAMVLGVSWLLGLVAPQLPVTSEMLSRTSPRLLDLIVALASGAICAYAATTPRLNAAIFGVSIAVALVPPLATAGLFLARADWPLAGGAMLLAFVNMVAIQAGTSVTLWWRGFRGPYGDGAEDIVAELRQQAVSILLLSALIISLVVHGLYLVRQKNFETKAMETIKSAVASQPEARLIDTVFNTEDGRVVATVVVRSPTRLTQAEVASLARRLPRAPDGSVVRLNVRHVEVDQVDDGR
jgi:uncharacterized membrane protein